MSRRSPAVIRGATGDRRFSPPAGYRYEGLYFVEAYWQEPGRSEFPIWRYRLVREPESADPSLPGDARPASTTPVARAVVHVQQQIRSTAAAPAAIIPFYVVKGHVPDVNISGAR